MVSLPRDNRTATLEVWTLSRTGGGYVPHFFVKASEKFFPCSQDPFTFASKFLHYDSKIYVFGGLVATLLQSRHVRIGPTTGVHVAQVLTIREPPHLLS